MLKELEHELTEREGEIERERERDKALKGQKARVKRNKGGKECEKERETM